VRQNVALLWMLTYMSLRDEINVHMQATPKRLFHLPPLFGSTAAVRTMIVVPDIYREAQPDAWPNNRKGQRLGQMRTDLDRFTKNDRIPIALFPKRKPPSTYLARLDPVTNEVWDIRSIDPKPGIRILGRFSERDTFVALVWDFHENVCGRTAWAAFGEHCLQEWNRLFPVTGPHTGTSANAYLSNNFFAV
jgi:hypothetical protein